MFVFLCILTFVKSASEFSVIRTMWILLTAEPRGVLWLPALSRRCVSEGQCGRETEPSRCSQAAGSHAPSPCYWVGWPRARGLTPLCLNFFLFINLFIYFWLRWVFVAARGLSLVAESRAALRHGVRASHCGGFSCCGAQALGAQASVVVACGLSSCGARA